MNQGEGSLPPRNVIERKLEDLLADRMTRETVAAWASPFALGEVAEKSDLTDIPAWDALTSLAMCDGRHSDGSYMYDKASFRAWLEQLRASPFKPSNK